MLLILILMLFPMAYAQTFVPCKGCPAEQNCFDPINKGHADLEGCERNANKEMFHYSQNDCSPMKYLGCGGNGNRYCSMFDCWILCTRFYNFGEEDK